MLLRCIALERFRQLDQHEYTFKPGLNLIKGPNEAGKTTLQEAILFALLGNPRHTTLERAKSVDDHISWGKNKRFIITLDFTDNSGIAYRLVKDWDSQSACLTNLQTREEENDIDSIHQAISELLGHGSLKLLQSTVCVEQDAIDEIAAGRREIGDQLQSIVTGGDAEEATASAVLRDLDCKIAETKRGWQTTALKNPGPIKVKRDEIARLEKQLSQIRPQVGQAEQAQEQLIVLDTRINEIREELTASQALKELCNRHLEWEDKRNTWRGREEELEAKLEQIEKAQKQVDEAGQPPDESLKSRLPMIPLIIAGTGCLLLLVGIVIGALGLLAASKPTLVIIGVLTALPGLLMCVGGLIWLTVALGRSRIGSGIAAQARIDALLGEKPLEELVEQRKEASRHRRDAEEALESSEMRRAAQVTPLEYEELKQDADHLEKELSEKEQERIKCETRCEVASYTPEDIHCLEENKAAAERSLTYLEERLSIYQLARDVIQEAKNKTMRSARDELEPRIAAYLREITRGRYDSVEADDDLNLRVFSREKGDWVAPESNELSQGTVDQLYLAARLALLDLLYHDAKLPLLLDDPFVKFDPDRCRQALTLCGKIAQDHQVLLFTCHDDYDAAADWIVEL